MNPWLFLLSGLVGAAIGYITNAIAIRMLFRPYKAYYIGKLKVPFTPGIIPRQRDRLALSLGKMVSQELFQKEGIVSHIDDESVQKVLYQTISKLTSIIFATNKASNSAEAVGFSLDSKGLSAHFLETFLHSPRFASSLRAVLASSFDSILSLKPNELGLSLKTLSRIQSFVTKFLAHKHTRQSGQRLLSSILISLGKRKSLLPKALVDELLGFAGHLADTSYPYLRKALMNALSQADIKADLVDRAKRLLTKAIDALNPLQRGLMRLGNYEASLHKILPNFVDQSLAELESFLASEQTTKLFSDLITDFIKEAGSLSLPELEARYKFSSKDLLMKAYEHVLTFLQEGALLRLFADSKALEQSDPDTSLGYLLGIDDDRKQVLTRQVSSYLILQARRPQLAAKLSKLILTCAETLFATKKVQSAQAEESELPLNAAFADKKESFDKLVVQTVSSLLQQVLPKVVEGFNLQKMVEVQVAKLDMAQLEKLIIGLVGREFAWINIFGALLGFVIGTMQVVLSLLLGASR